MRPAYSALSCLKKVRSWFSSVEIIKLCSLSRNPFIRMCKLNPSRQVAAGLNKMNSKKFAKRMKDSGVSPVIATILMVAITVVLAAVLYVMVSGFTHSPGTANSAGLTSSNTAANTWTISVTSASSSNLPVSNLKITFSGSTVTYVTGSISESTGAIQYLSLVSAETVGTTAPASGTSYLEIQWGTTGTYLSVGDTVTLTLVTNGGALAAGSSLSGTTVGLYNTNSVLGSVTL